ncbi:hypothetical protein ORJ04_00175 [Rheinheimera baltica]|uniref:Uncharacterized protein n=1 Tax=Rheinheimera baltica TaxID=67576 RepID=A0ABT9HTB5_9GAMM|nr:hypothetical protein [Rheinheimera baltica]MDP5134362.1 hypothetical protein [Rheinheimera baltica]
MAKFIFTFLPIFGIAMLCLKVTLFSVIIEDTNKKRDHQFMLLIILTFIVSMVVTSFIYFAENNKVELGDLGAIGDYFGGLLNPILAFASFIALLYTVNLQSKGLRDSEAATTKAQLQLAQDMLFQGALSLFSRAEDRLTECDRELDTNYALASTTDSLSLKSLLLQYGEIHDKTRFNMTIRSACMVFQSVEFGRGNAPDPENIFFALNQLNDKFRVAFQYVESCGRLLARAGQENAKDSLLMPTIIRLADIAFYLQLAGKHDEVYELTGNRPSNFFIDQYLCELERKIFQFSNN